MIVYLTLPDLLEIVEALRVGPVVDLGLLDAALARPPSAYFGIEAYPSIPTKAAALLDSLGNRHGLQDGQKRMALTATIVFLRLNGFDTEMTQNEAHDLTLDVATGLHDLVQISSRLKVVRAEASPGGARAPASTPQAAGAGRPRRRVRSAGSPRPNRG